MMIMNSYKFVTVALVLALAFLAESTLAVKKVRERKIVAVSSPGEERESNGQESSVENKVEVNPSFNVKFDGTHQANSPVNVAEKTALNNQPKSESIDVSYLIIQIFRISCSHSSNLQFNHYRSKKRQTI